MSQRVQVRHEYDFHVLLQQGHDDLPRDLGTLAFIGCGKGFVAQQQRVFLDVIDDFAHSLEFLIELAALHRCIFLALVVGEDPVAHVRRERCCRDEHPALHHDLRQPKRSQKRRLAALIGARDDNEFLAVAVHVIANRRPPDAQCQARVVQPFNDVTSFNALPWTRNARDEIPPC